LDPLALSSIVSTKWVVIFWLVCCVIMAVRAIWSELRIVADVILAFWIAGMGAAFVRALWKRRQR
jgi:dolichyl-phosphate-mannose--protein O-mannosyl transferase